MNNTKPLGQRETDEYPTLGGGVLGSDNMKVLGYGDLGRGQNKEREMKGWFNQERCKCRPSVEDVQNEIDSWLFWFDENK